MERTYFNKLDPLEEEYQNEQRQLEASLESAFTEKQTFMQELDNLSENYRYYHQQAEFDEPTNMSSVYHLFEQCQDEGNKLVNQTMHRLEEQKEENSLVYRKETKKIEDELTLLKEKERKNENE